MNWLLFAVALAGCGTDEHDVTLPSDAHYKVLFNPWPTMGQCLANTPDPADCAVPLALSLCESGRAVFSRNGMAEEGTYAMDDADQGQSWIATIVTRRSLTWFDVEIKALVMSPEHRWEMDDAPGVDCAER